MKAKATSEKLISSNTHRVLRKLRPHLCASGSLLLPLAQKWGLVRIAVVGLFAVIALSFFATSSVSAASLSITLSGASLSISNLSSIQNGGFGTAEGTVKVSGEAVWGHTLTVKSANKDGSNTLTSKEGQTLPSITSSTNEASFPVNHWGFKPDKYQSNANTNYLPGPAKADTLINKATTATDTTGTTYNITIAAKVDDSQAAGTYSGSFTFTATANYVDYNITYDLNGGMNGPAAQKSTSTEKNLTLTNTSPTKTGYEFKGWCTKSTSNETCAGDTYQPGQSYPLSSDGNTATLYAMWKTIVPTTMQDFGNYCSLMATNQQIKLKDSRDNTEYNIAKLKDGKCWMIENLRLGKGKSTGSRISLTSADSDVPANGFTITMTAIENKTTDYNFDASYVDSNYGGYYSWHTATAGTGLASMSTQGTNAANSICPKGWQLPTGGNNGKFMNLVIAYAGSNYDSTAGSSDIRATPIPGFTLASYIYNGDFYAKGVDGCYWSSTVISDSQAYTLYFTSSLVHTAGYGMKYIGASVRCVSRQ